MNEKWEITPEKFLNTNELAALLIRAEEIKTLGLARNRRQLVRDWMIINLFIMTGLRRAEACNLKCTDFKIYGGNSYLIVQRGKGGKLRHVHLAKGFKKDVSWFLRWKVEQGELDGPDAYFFRTERSQQYSPSGIYKRWKKYVPNHRLHDARHTHATALYEATKSLRLVQKTLGHASLTTTQVYADISVEQSIEGMTQMERLVRSTTKRARTPKPFPPAA